MQSNFPVSLRLIGGGDLYATLVLKIAEAQLNQIISLAGLITDKEILMKEYEDADLFILPTYHEGFPRVLYEAMSKALPIITTMVGGIPGRMEDKVNCLAIRPGCPGEIADAIMSVWGNHDLYNHLSDHGLKTVKQVLSASRSHSDLLVEKLS
jgi:glycosyltransferase involved in cell wall biosynthesis